jgi:hypothetical protein
VTRIGRRHYRVRAVVLRLARENKS